MPTRGPGMFWPDHDDLVGVCDDCVGRAEAALSALEPEFLPAARLILASIAGAVDTLSMGGRVDPVTAVAEPARIIADTGETLGYELIGEIAGWLRDLAETGAPLRLVELHLRALRIAVRSGLKGDGGAAGAELRAALAGARALGERAA